MGPQTVPRKKRGPGQGSGYRAGPRKKKRGTANTGGAGREIFAPPRPEANTGPKDVESMQCVDKGRVVLIGIVKEEREREVRL